MMKKRIRELWNDFEFPYHYGSHATRPTFLKSGGTFFVSIPLWFSRNYKTKPEEVNGMKHVSIPLWFSRNWTPSFTYLYRLEFPYHYGSHATMQ